MNKKQRRWRNRIVAAIAIFAVIMVVDKTGLLAGLVGAAAEPYVAFALYLVPFLISGHDVLAKAARNIRHGEAFDEAFLMSVATIGAFATILFPDTESQAAEGCAVMLFYQVGELFQSYAVGKSRKSISELMDIAPDYANVERDGGLEEVDPE